MSERKLISRRGALVLLLIAVLCAAAFLILKFLPPGKVAVVEKNGEVIIRQNLSEITDEKEISVEGEDGIELKIAFYPDGARVLSSECPDKICVNQGKLTLSGQTAVCLPAKVTLRLEGSGGVDAET